jgi:hypothetical protein
MIGIVFLQQFALVNCLDGERDILIAARAIAPRIAAGLCKRGSDLPWRQARLNGSRPLFRHSQLPRSLLDALDDLA